MKKVRLIRTMIAEYELDESVYPEEITTPEEMAQFDADADDRELLFDSIIEDSVKWELIDGDKIIASGKSNTDFE